MATIAKKTAPKADKQNLAQEITEKLEIALESFKEVWGEKKFKNRIKKASKLFSKGKHKKIAVKKEAAAPKKKAAKQAVRKSAPVQK